MSVFPSIRLESPAMRPVTRITILGTRLAVAVLAVYWVVIFTGTHLPQTIDITPKMSDKLKHFTAFFGLGALLCYVTNGSGFWRRFGMIGAVGMTYAALDEWTQRLVPGRVADPMDFVADSAGLWTAILLYVVARHFAKDRVHGLLRTTG